MSEGGPHSYLAWFVVHVRFLRARGCDPLDYWYTVDPGGELRLHCKR